MTHAEASILSRGPGVPPVRVERIGETTASSPGSADMASTPDLQWPPDRFYWAMVEAPGLRTAGPLPPGLLPMAEEQIPAPMEGLHAVCMPLDASQVLVCAAARDELASLPAAISTLSPSSIPADIAVGANASALNLLIGEFEPREARRARLRSHALAATAVLICASLITIGFARRAAHFNALSSEARAAIFSAVESTLENPTSPFALREMRTVRDSLQNAAAITHPTDATPALAALLATWPAEVSSTPQTITATADDLSISVAVEGDPARFLAAFTPPDGWTMDQPRLNAAGDVTRIVIRLRQSRKEPT